MNIQDRIDENSGERSIAKKQIMSLIDRNRLRIGDSSEYGVIFEGMTIPRYVPWERGHSYHTALSDDRFHMIDQLERSAPDGAAVEMGVFTGGVTRMFLDAGRPTFAFDTFEGIAGADPKVDMHKDGEYHGGDVLDYIAGAKIVKGEIPDSLATITMPMISIAHIDLDVKAPTAAALDWVYSRLHMDGVIIMDDYGSSTCPGVREAVDEFQDGRKLYIPTGQMIIWRAVR